MERLTFDGNFCDIAQCTSNPYHCDIFTCQRRDTGTVLIASNHTLTKDEFIALRRINNG